MAFTVGIQRKDLFSSLKRMPVGQRIKALKESAPQGEASPFSLLTPHDFSLLFPKYYQKALPDVGGFREAISQKSAQRQSDIMSGLAENQGITVEQAEKIGRTKRLSEGTPDVMDKPERVSKSSSTWGRSDKGPKLTPKQEADLQELEKGPKKASDMKYLETLSDEELKKAHIQKYKDEKGESYYKAVGATEEEAVKSLKAGGADVEKLAKIIPNIRNNPELAKELAVSAKQLGVTPGALALMLKVENPSLNPTTAGGAGGKYNGLYQMGSKELSSVGYTPEQFRNLSAVEQTKVWTQWMEKINFKGRANLVPGDTNQNFTMLQANQLGSGANLKALNPDEVITKSQQASEIGGRQTSLNSLLQYAQKRNPGNEGGEKAEEGKGPGGAYTKEQIDARIAELNSTTISASRRNELAKDLDSHGVNINNVDTSANKVDVSAVKLSGRTTDHKGAGVQCADLSKFYAPGIGHAGEWKFHSGHDGMVPGAVIATTNYGNGNGGKEAKAFGGVSHFHTGVLLTAPDANGNALIYDQARGHGARITRVNVNNYNNTGTPMAVIQGGESSEQSRRAIEDARAQATSAELAAINQAGEGKSFTIPTETSDAAKIQEQESGPDNVDHDGSSTEVASQKQAPVDTSKLIQDASLKAPDGTHWEKRGNDKVLVDNKSGAGVYQMQGTKRYDEVVSALQQQKGEAPKATPTVTVEKPKEPEKPKGPVAGLYQVDREAFKEASKPGAAKKGYAGWMVDMASWNDIRDGFNKDPDAKKAGAYIDENWKLHVKDKNASGVKELLDEYKGNVLSEIQQKAEVEAKKQTASVSETVQREFGVASAQAQELDMTNPDVQAQILAEREKKMKMQETPAQTQPTEQAPNAPVRETSAPKPTEPTKASAGAPKTETSSSAPKAEAPKPTTPAPAPQQSQAGKPDESSTKNFLRSQGIPGASDGGSFNIGDRDIGFYPMDKKDNLAAVDTKTQEPLFTAKTGENINVDPLQNRIDVTPQPKVNGSIPPGTKMSEMNDVIDTMFDMASSMGKASNINPPTIDRSETPQKQVVIDPFINQKTTGFPTPSLERAMSKARGRESDYSPNRVSSGTSIA